VTYAISARWLCNEPPLVIPATAPLITGKRAVVYVRVPDAEKPTFEGREVVLGPRAGNYYLVKEGLSEGDVVVTRGNFKIDSALQIQAKPSMMSVKGDRQVLEVAEEFREQIWGFVTSYIVLNKALVSDSSREAAGAAGEALGVLAEVDMGLVTGRAHDLWMSHAGKIRAALNEIKTSSDIERMRKAFERLSNELIVAVGQFGIPLGKTLYKTHCPMAFDNKGADWLQLDEAILNPYFGASMLRCGEVKEVIGNKTK